MAEFWTGTLLPLIIMVLESLLLLRLSAKELRPLLEKPAVVAGCGEEAERIGAIDLGYAGSAVFQEIPVMRYKDGCKGG